MFLATKGQYPPIRMALGQYEPETTRLFERLIKPGMAVLDIGAHVGYFSLLAAKQAGPSGRVFSFEPHPDNYSLLIKNVKENAYETITTVNQGASATSGNSTLHQSRLDNGRHSIYRQDLLQQGSVPISTTSMDDFFGVIDWPKIDLVKIDVEGAELDVLSGMAGLLERCRDIRLIVELNPVSLEQAQVEPISLPKTLESLGFVLHMVDSLSEPSKLHGHELRPLIDRLYSSGDSVNLYCFRN